MLASMFTNTVRADLISVRQEENSEGIVLSEENGNGLLSSEQEHSQDISMLSLEKKEESGNKGKDTQETKALMSDTDEFDIEKYILNTQEIDVINAEEILAKLDLSASEEIPDFDYVIKNYTYRNDMAEVYRNINDDAVSVIDRYMQKTSYIPLKDPLWFLAIGAVEYNRGNDSDIICSWPVDTEKYKEDSGYMLGYSWKEVQRRYGNSAVTGRTGGAIGPFQMESFYGKGVSPVIPDEFGIIGSAQQRSDCWVELGACTDSGSSIIWQPGTYADRWSIADAANLCLGVYDESLRKVNGKCALTELDNKYEQAAFLMWAHNRGTGILGKTEYKEKVKKICLHLDELKDVIYRVKPDRFTRTGEIMNTVKRIASESDCDTYPVMALASYLIVEARYSGVW